MNKLLVSAANQAEAFELLQADIDIIDLKNPSAGALGALNVAEIRCIVERVDRRKVISATVGDLPMQPRLLMHAVAEMAHTGVDIVKIGFFGGCNQTVCIEGLRQLTDSICMVAVLMADEAPDFSLLPELHQAGFYGVMLDTAKKDGRSLLDCLPHAAIQDFTRHARQAGLVCGLAGSLQLAGLPQMSSYGADYLGFRGALCLDNRRQSALDMDKVQALTGLLRKYNSPVQTSLDRLALHGRALHVA